MLYLEASTKTVHALNGSGKAPAALTLERCLSDLPKSLTGITSNPTGDGSLIDADGKLLEEIPPLHPHSVTVPGAAAGWCDAVSKFGSGVLSLSELMEPAALLAEEGFPVSPITSYHWGLCDYQLDAGPHGGALRMPTGKSPATGDVFRNPDMAGVLRELGAGGKQAFYGGRVGLAMVEVLQELGGVLTVDDLKVTPTFPPLVIFI